MSFPRYPKYKTSGVEWLGDVPEGWVVLPLKRIVSVPITDGPHETPQFVEEGVPFVSAEAVSSGQIDFTKVRACISPEDNDRYSKKYSPKLHDIYMVKSGATTGVTALVEDRTDFNIWSPLAVIRCNNGSVPHFVLNFMRSRPFLEAVTLFWSFGTQQNIGMGVIENLACTVPPLPEQTAIAEFLDRETGKIDELVAEQRRLMELLKEKRQAVISHAVTKGLNPHAPMKPSGIEWLGDVPEHWDCVRNKVIFEEISERSFSGEGELMTVSHITGVTPRAHKDVNMFLAETLEGYKKCRRGDLVINTMWAWMGALGCSPCDGLVSPAYNIYRPRDARRLSPAYYDFLCRLPSHVVTMKANSSGVWESRLRLYPGAFLSMMLPVPPLKEQVSIIDFIETELPKFDTLTTEAQRAIILLQERRTALISAAVTGQIDVRNHSPKH